MTCADHDRDAHPDPEPEHRPDRRAGLAARARRGAARRRGLTSQAGGKGVNISRAATAAGVPTIAVLPARQGRPVRARAARATASTAGRRSRPATSGSTSPSPSPTAPPPRSTAPAPRVTPADLDRLADAVVRRARQAAWVVLAGSLPPGAPDGWYADLVGPARDLPRAGGGGHLRRAAARARRSACEHAAPALMKPNGEELASLTGGDADGHRGRPRGRRPAAGELVDRGVGAVLVTLGGSGAVLVTAERVLARRPSPHDRRQHRGCRRLQPVRLPARRPARRRSRPSDCGWRWPTAARPRAFPAPPSPPPTTCTRSSSTSASSHSPHRVRYDPMTDPIITPALVRLDAALGDDKDTVIRALAGVVAAAGRTGDADGLAADALAREATSATGLPGGIAIPHCRTEHVEVPTLAFARLVAGRRLRRQGRPGGPRVPDRRPGRRRRDAPAAADQAGPRAGQAGVHRQPARGRHRRRGGRAGRRRGRPRPCSAQPAPGGSGRTRRPRRRLPRSRPSRRRGAAPSSPSPPAPPASPTPTWPRRRSRPPRGAPASTSTSRPRAPPVPRRSTWQTIRDADAAIFATDVGVKDRSRFAGKPVVASGVKRAIDDSDAMIAEALRYADDPHAPRVEGSADAAAARADRARRGAVGAAGPPGADDRRVLHDPVRRRRRSAHRAVVPARRLRDRARRTPQQDHEQLHHLQPARRGGPRPAPRLFGRPGRLPRRGVLHARGAAFKFLVPALAGYIAYAIADRPGIAPGFVMGAIANRGSVDRTGFLGGIIGGVLAGVLAHWIASWKVPAWARGLMPVVVIPLLATLVSGCDHARGPRQAPRGADGLTQQRPARTWPAAAPASSSAWCSA